MPEEYRNIYKTARKAAGLTQEAAAERLDISVESIRAYETGQRIPPNGVVARMAVTYNNLTLGYEHVRSTNDLMADIVPPLEQRSMIEMVVRLGNRMRRFDRNRCLDRLMEIAEDNNVDDEERPEYNEIILEMREIIRGGLELDVSSRDGQAVPENEEV